MAEDKKEKAPPPPDPRNVYQRMRDVAKETEGVAKDKYNADQKYKYSSHDAVVDAVRDAMCKHGVLYILDTNEFKEEHFEVQGKYGPRSVYVATGIFQWIVVNVDNPDDRYSGKIHMTAQDSGDKAGAKLLSYVKKYGLLACVGLLLPTGIDADDDKKRKQNDDEDDDRDRRLPPGVTPPAPPRRPPAQQQAPAPAPTGNAGEDTPTERKRMGQEMFARLKDTGLVNVEPWKKLAAALGGDAPFTIQNMPYDEYVQHLSRFQARARQWYAIIAHAASHDVPDSTIEACARSAGFNGHEWFIATTDQLVACFDAMVKASGKKPAPAPSGPEPSEPPIEEELPFD